MVIKQYTVFLFGIPILSAVLFSNLVFAEQPPLERWVARYNGPENNIDEAKDITIDNAGNIYVTGDSRAGEENYDYVTIKYNSAGNQLWAVRYDGGYGDDNAYAIAVDNSGNVYVTGCSAGSGTGVDYLTIKYGPAGNKLWEMRYTGPGGDYDCAEAIAVDNAGNVYVTGASYGGSSRYDYVTVKYNSSGSQLWASRYDGPAKETDEAKALAVDNSGNICVTGTSDGGSTNLDYATIKYDPNGDRLWVTRYDGLFNHDFACDLAVDNSGNIYVTGYSDNLIDTDYATVKYNPAGTQLWVARYNGPGEDCFDYAAALALDNSGNVYVTGFSYDFYTTKDYATVKYGSNGNQLWVARYNGSSDEDDLAYDITVDAFGNVYVTGESIVGFTYDYGTVKYDTDGGQLWAAFYNGPAGYGDGAYALVADDLGNIYVTGTSTNDFATIKYTQHNYCTDAIASDLNGDCKIDFTDYALLAENWLTENDWSDLAALTSDWLQCNFALTDDCW